MASEEGKVKVVIFDLNGTFYNESSKDEFFKFVAAKKPHRLGYYFQMVYYKALLKLNQIRQTEFKENFFNYLDYLPPEQVAAYAKEFWRQEFPKNFNRELKGKFDQHKENGVQLFCATGGLELYVKPLFELYDISGLFGTQVKYENNTYLVQGEACKDEEKLKRLNKHFNGKPYQIIEAYSDSKEAILKEAEEAYLVKDGIISPYKEDEK